MKTQLGTNEIENRKGRKIMKPKEVKEFITDSKDRSWSKGVWRLGSVTGVYRQEELSFLIGLQINITQQLCPCKSSCIILWIPNYKTMILVLCLQCEIPKEVIWMTLSGLHHPCCHCGLIGQEPAIPLRSLQAMTRKEPGYNGLDEIGVYFPYTSIYWRWLAIANCASLLNSTFSNAVHHNGSLRSAISFWVFTSQKLQNAKIIKAFFAGNW